MVSDLLVVTVLNMNRIPHHPIKADYTQEHVDVLEYQVRKHLPGAEFRCLTYENYPGWWAKMHVFNINHEGKNVLYLDLDTMIRGDCEFLSTYKNGFWMLENVNRPRTPGSGVMYWTKEQDMRYLYEIFKKDAARYIEEYTKPDKWGDQDFIRDHAKNYKFLNGYRAVSAIRPNGGDLNDCDILYFHGNRKPWTIAPYSGEYQSIKRKIEIEREQGAARDAG